MVAASSTTTAVPFEAINDAICLCISTVAAGEVAGLSSEPWLAGGTKRPTPSTPEGLTKVDD